ncbi:stage V sporulation protein T [Tetzosporium hominis]|uniref:Stage V sporulation protein T n=1 Tax=Tetzosporium hominis TaxID=2020506 RepID=A0A264W5S3_9BACL|nr:stage V sporulation protein T [Tetzosporium hominis]OZS78924.1 stage V sporulation protein T [Tetzosporium hominis]
MKATGIVRRIDDLGRVMIPKEIRRTMRIREGDPLEIFTDREGEIILKKYSPIHELGTFASEYAEALYETLGTPVMITDQDEVVAVAGLSKKEYIKRRLASLTEDALITKQKVVEKHEESVEWIPGVKETVRSYGIVPILLNGDMIGGLFILSKVHYIGDPEMKALETAASFLSKQING